MTKEEIKFVMQWCLPIDTTPKKLDKAVETFINEHKVAINYTRCCTELKDKEVISFRDWVKQNKYTRFGNGYQRNEIVFSKEEMWQRFENRN